ncbi:Oxygen regulatory protein NreC [compost metagenome]
MEVLELIGEGFTNLQIADKLFLSKRTVEGHRQNLLEKTGVKNTAALIKYAIKTGLMQ